MVVRKRGPSAIFMVFSASGDIVHMVGSKREAGALTCQELADFCLDFVDGSLPDEERARFQLHLGLCGECVAFFETYRKTPEISRQAVALQMPADLKDAIRTFLRSRYED